jgi:alanine-synthesizing transaminase
MVSRRLPSDLAPNATTRALALLRAEGVYLLDLTESNPTRAGLDYPEDLLTPLADRRALTYDPQPLGHISAREAVAREFARRGVQVEDDLIALTASTSDAYSLLFKLFCDPGDAVLVPQPSYPLFEHLTRFESVEAVAYRVEYHGTWRVDIDNVRHNLTNRTRALLIVSPNNPTGAFLHDDDLVQLTTLCRSCGVALIGDEVFADYPLDPAPRACSVLAQAEVVTCSLGGLSKSIGLPQAKLGWIAFGGPSAAVREVLQAYEVLADAYLSVSTPVQLAAPKLLEHGVVVREQIRRRLESNLQRLRQAAANFPAVRVLTCEGGWSAVIQVPFIRSEETLVLELLKEDHVIVHPGFFFDFERESYVVVSLLVEPTTFASGIARLLTRAAFH